MSIPFVLALDVFWIGLLMSGFYKAQLGPLLRMKGGNLDVLWGYAIWIYVLIPLGVSLFVPPLVDLSRTQGSHPLVSALTYGFIYGLILYGVYDLTNASLLKGWPAWVTVVDIAWGGLLCGATALWVQWWRG